MIFEYINQLSLYHSLYTFSINKCLKGRIKRPSIHKYLTNGENKRVYPQTFNYISLIFSVTLEERLIILKTPLRLSFVDVKRNYYYSNHKEHLAPRITGFKFYLSQKFYGTSKNRSRNT